VSQWVKYISISKPHISALRKDAVKCAETLQKLVTLRRKHGTSQEVNYYFHLEKGHSLNDIVERKSVLLSS
jgi:hypothetical protein